jgi:cell division transport system permease protein
VYLTDEATPADRRSIESAIARDPDVAEREAVSKAEALERFKQTFGDLAAVADGAGENPLPASYEVRMKPGSAKSAVERLAASVQKLPGVADVRYDRQWLDRVLTAIAMLRAAGVLLGLILATAAALTVATVVRLALALRNDELEIMELVGAPRIYVHGPFVMEGILQGGIGSALALAGLLAGFLVLRARYLVPMAPAVDVSAIRFLSVGLCVALVAGGMIVACLGGLLAARTGR